MKMCIEKMFQKEMEYVVVDDEDLTKKVDELESELTKFKGKLFRTKSVNDERRRANEQVPIEK